MRISDWSSDVCSSDLTGEAGGRQGFRANCKGSRTCSSSEKQTNYEQKRVRSNGSDDSGAKPGRRMIVSVVNDLPASMGGQCRSEERSVGKACVSTGRSRREPYT